MATEVQVPIDEDAPLPVMTDTPIDIVPVTTKPPRKKRLNGDGEDAKDDADAEEAKPGKTPVSPELKKVMAAEDGDLRDVLDTIGTDGSYKIAVTRIEPEQARDPLTGRMVKVDGHLKTYTQKIDQEFIGARHGGGKFRLNFLKKAADGSYKIHTKRVIDIAGDPRTDDVPRNVDPVSHGSTQVAQANEQPSIVRDVLGVMKDQLDKANERGKSSGHTGPDPAIMMLLEEYRSTNARQAAEMLELRKELTAKLTEKPEKTEGDAFKDGLVKQLLDGDSTRLTAVRLQYESELRQLKENQSANENRMRDNFDRDMKRIDDAHKREVDFIKTSHLAQLEAIKHAHTASEASIKTSLDTSKEVMKGQIEQLKRENDTLREDVKELRAKKEKSPLEMAKEYEVYQDVFGNGKDKDESTVDKIVSALPQAIEVAQGIISKNKPAAAPAQQQPQRPSLVRDPAGNTFQVRGNELIPVRKKGVKVAVPATAEGAPPTEVEIPAIDPEKLSNAIAYLERAFSGNQDPEIFAQTARPVIPEEIMQSIQTLGIDVFFAKVAKLPSASPLATQAGKNWIRKVGKALVGE